MRLNCIFVVFVLAMQGTSGIRWDRARCSPDPDQMVPEGAAPDIGRFPWLGVVQHSFSIGGQPRFAVTAGVLIHPTYAIAPAEDIAKIAPDALANNTKFILWQSNSSKFVLDVVEYTLHPEFIQGLTLASLALLEVDTRGEIGITGVGTPILPVCLNIEGGGALDDLYAVKMTDIKGELIKEVYKMDFVESKDCEEFYNRAKLSYAKMKPTRSLCAATHEQHHACVWEGGTALVSRQHWGYWKLIGFGVRGPGCGAPARFITLASQLQWIQDAISLADDEKLGEDTHKIYFRRVSPIQLHMFKGGANIPKQQGQCDRKQRGNVMFKDSSEVLVNKNFAQGFYFVSVTQVAQFTCAVVMVESMSRTNAAVWVEHHCHRELTGLSPSMTRGPDYRRLECFMYFKSNAYIEFRFFFSFRVNIELSLYGREEARFVGNPFISTETTEDWSPTAEYLRWGTFAPFYVSWWQM